VFVVETLAGGRYADCAVRRLLLPVLVALAALTACGSESSSRVSISVGKPERAVRDVSNVLELRAAFNDDRGSPRLLLILSPT
jgi:hypothetical protein